MRWYGFGARNDTIELPRHTPTHFFDDIEAIYQSNTHSKGATKRQKTIRLWKYYRNQRKMITRRSVKKFIIVYIVMNTFSDSVQ